MCTVVEAKNHRNTPHSLQFESTVAGELKIFLHKCVEGATELFLI